MPNHYQRSITHVMMRSCLPLLAILVAAITLHAQDGDPRHPGLQRFEELGTIFGKETGALWPLGDLNSDGLADFAVERYLDTLALPGRPAQEVVLFFGVRGSIPRAENAVRIGPDQLLSRTMILATGDWDGRNGPDICAHSSLYGDTTFGNADLFYEGTSVVIVYWNQGGGKYSTEDTSRLYPGVAGGLYALQGVGEDLDGDQVDDLFLKGSGTSRRDTGIATVPKGMIFLGKNGSQWGKDNRSVLPDWIWWNAPEATRLDVEDLDRDGTVDLSLVSFQPSGVSVLYGNSRGLPDTNDVRSVSLWDSTLSTWSVFADVTGDRIPELLTLSQNDDLTRVYIGLKGQRLLEQYGSGHDSANADSTQWWGKPWAEIKGPNYVDQTWPGFDNVMYDLGSADTNATEEIWVVSDPFLLAYQGGVLLDSLIDLEYDTRPKPVKDVKRLGDIDGDGRAEIALVNASGVHLLRLPTLLPTPVVKRRRVPDGTDRPDTTSGVDEEHVRSGNDPARLDLSLGTEPVAP